MLTERSAEALETTSATDDQRAGELAYHWAQAVQPTDTAKVIHYAKVAGARALDQLAPDDALRWYAQVQDLLDRTPDIDPRIQIEVLIGLGDAERQCGMAAHREHLLDAACLADEIDAVDLLVRAVLTNSRGYGSNIGHADHDRIAMIRRALDRLPAPDSADRATLLANLATELVYEAEFDERLAIARDAVAVARGSGDPVALCRALYSASVSTRAPSTLAQCTEWLNEGCALADRLDDPIARWETYSERRNWALIEGNLARLRECDAVARAAIEGVPLPALHWTNDILGPCHSIVAGDLVEGERLIEAALQLGLDIGQPDAFTIYAAQHAFVRFQQGRLDEVVSLIEHATADAPAIRAYRPILAMAYARSGEETHAAQLLDEGLTDGFGLPLDVSWTTGMASWTEAAAIVEHRDAAPLLHDLLAPYHAQIVTSLISVQPAVAHYLGILDHLLGHYDAAERWFTEAMEIAERMDSPLLVAYTNAASAALLADRGEDEERHRARTMAESALTAASAGGYGYIERDARAVLDQLR